MFIKKHLSALNTAVLLALVSVSVNANAASGFDKVNQMLNSIIAGMHVISIATATLAGLYVGFRVLWDGRALMDMKNVIIGAGIIIGIAELVALVIS
ncbi:MULTISPECIES: TrbC/VirB2 family protein [Serratia]|uniref:TrbC/VirB2 family protein n=1 Tax=Serratia TaxID=613 RepID=UPI00074542EE|nr:MULTISPECIES: TrbC/VirB2 family protein [Serratia]EBR7327608.1 TriB protein [Salmonella enterica]MBJ2083095.1 TrbC/VirB2 family protein [Serratia ureilytica]CVG67142.1 TrbC/VIRB2 family [Serratia marcescens]